MNSPELQVPNFGSDTCQSRTQPSSHIFMGVGLSLLVAFGLGTAGRPGVAETAILVIGTSLIWIAIFLLERNRSESRNCDDRAALSSERAAVHEALDSLRRADVEGRAETERRRLELERLEERITATVLQGERLSILGELVAGVAHELNNPLSIISGYAELLAAEPWPTETQDVLRQITGAVFRCKKTVNNLVAYSTHRAPVRRHVDLGALLADALALRAYQLKVAGIQVTRDLTPLPEVMADPFQLQQALFNLVNNAYQALRDWQGPRQIWVRTRHQGDMAVVEIEDSGPGMDQETQRRCFEPFFTTKRSGDGTGLGLSISQSIVRRFGGEIAVQSTDGRGTTVRVTVPVGGSAADIVPATAKPAIAEPAVTTVGRRVLVVDDEPAIGSFCQLGLERCGCKVDVATSGDQALSLLATSSYDVVVTDLWMPGLAGRALQQRIAERNPVLARRMLFITGDHGSQLADVGLSELSGDVLVKPFELKDLQQRVLARLRPP
ncbi:MAG: response regulator [Candidatus Riflebacteria bacterium]|nr:response regulator [Candidatus Riflebacteria bacterium]